MKRPRGARTSALVARQHPGPAGRTAAARTEGRNRARCTANSGRQLLESHSHHNMLISSKGLLIGSVVFTGCSMSISSVFSGAVDPDVGVNAMRSFSVFVLTGVRNCRGSRRGPRPAAARSRRPPKPR